MESMNTNIENITTQEALPQSPQIESQAKSQEKQEDIESRSKLMSELARMHRIEESSREKIAQKLGPSIEEIDMLLADPMLEQAYQNMIHETALQEKMQEMMLEPMLQELTLPTLIEKFAGENKFREKAAGDILICMLELSEFKERLSKYKFSIVSKLVDEYVYHNCSDPYALGEKLKIKVATVSTLQKSPLCIEKQSKKIDLICQDYKYVGKVFKEAVLYRSKEEIVNKTKLCPEAVEKILNDAHFIADLNQHRRNTELMPQKQKALMLLLQGYSKTETAKNVGVDRTSLWRWEQEENFQRKYRELLYEQKEAFENEIAFIRKRAMETLKTNQLNCRDAIRIFEKITPFLQEDSQKHKKLDPGV